MDDEHVPLNDRVSTLECTVDEVRSQGEATQALLQELLSKLGPVLAPPVNAPTVTAWLPTPTPANSTPSAGRKTLLRPSALAEFDGDRTKGKTFLTSCRTYICLCPEALG
jgi:hypothetical protein